jgi:hypothetical protein
MPFHGGPLTTTVIKMHGDLRHEEHIIVTAEDYDRYLTDYPMIATYLSAHLSHAQLCTLATVFPIQIF